MSQQTDSPRSGSPRRAALVATLLSPLLASAAAAAPSKCKLMTVAQIPIDMRNTSPVISALVDGHATRMIIDTGSYNSLIFRSAAAAFGLKIVERGGKSYAAGGMENLGVVTVHDLNVAGFVVHNLILTTAGHGRPSGDYGGVLGEDFLSHWDLEFDPAAGVMRLMVPKDCTGDQVVYWAPNYSVVSLLPDSSHHLAANVQLNGHDLLAIFDTGAAYTIVTADVARRPGLHPTVTAATGQRGRGLGPESFAIDTAVFPSITIGQETIQNPKLAVADLFSKNKELSIGSHVQSKPEGEPEILIGVDFFRAHRVYVARGQKQMYFTYLGGPVFLNDHQAPQQAATPGGEAPHSDTSPAAAAPTPAAAPDPATSK